ncbi:type II toxin-antitoxin system death-on-curing family toxin [Staphylococcus hominis]|uniref:type II toxin-antitoxin system death-on-curing family toxin n=1 Tax=Staphylococcus TaxID=1279 RepID=UPI0008AA1824|nr:MULTISPECIES: type II toxin-antitoxin system death-on-curing family toxin [Staphylococcus]MBO0380100.1 type II toxin-antitoxin system death-on-curing family toxin [Staphylococcus hominis]MBS9538555.1 type II toxin-antitoxin system death-on-curing family toxin [Staphylococcus hominis subsp. novobiosepticus]MCI2927499.1 type II toxin-antitoxin system death-on-curing family toxin [Staphylococcus hominis]MCK6225073.1 type II toxin-antitoxin system death-on-curing family toxin [Staphylococcus hom
MENIYYFDSQHAIKEHDKVIKETGGLKGIKDKSTLESFLTHLQNDMYYPTFELKLSRLVFCFTQFHVFNDGNKRSAIALGAYFLKINDFDYCTDTFIEEMENIVYWLAYGLINEELLIQIINSILLYDCLIEPIKIELINVAIQYKILEQQEN